MPLRGDTGHSCWLTRAHTRSPHALRRAFCREAGINRIAIPHRRTIPTPAGEGAGRIIVPRVWGRREVENV